MTYNANNGDTRAPHWSPHKRQAILEMLAAYEDTGLTPGEIMKLKGERGDDREGTQPESEAMA
jgi:hypothetical protein